MWRMVPQRNIHATVATIIKNGIIYIRGVPNAKIPVKRIALYTKHLLRLYIAVVIMKLVKLHALYAGASRIHKTGNLIKPAVSRNKSVPFLLGLLLITDPPLAPWTTFTTTMPVPQVGMI